MQQQYWQQDGLRSNVMKFWQKVDSWATQNTKVLKTKLIVRIFMSLDLLSLHAGSFPSTLLVVRLI